MASGTGKYKRHLRRTPVVLSLAIIGLALFFALFPYALAPDNSPNANRMIIELSAKPAFFQKDILELPVAEPPHPNPLWWITGKPQAYKALPINGYFFRGDSLLVRHYVDEGLEDTIGYAHAYWHRHFQHRQLNSGDVLLENIQSQTFLLGTDRYGRDILSRIMAGARVSMCVGLVAVALSVLLGVLLGAIAGYYRGRTDDVVMWLVNVLWAIPTLLLVFAITLTLGKGFWQIFIAIGLTMWIGTARLVRGQVMVVRRMDYITAARALGLSDWRIIRHHILPNIAGAILVLAASNFAAAILIEAGLSFLGIGVQPPTPSWGLMVKEHINFLVTNRPLPALAPGIAIMLVVYAFNILGNALRDAIASD